MNPLVKKEIRLLLPGIATCCALGLTNLFFRFDSDGSLQNWWLILPAFVFCGLMTVTLALNSFGSEISMGTFSNLLAQPVSRQKIWDTKILVLAASLLAVGIFWSACGIIRLTMLGRNPGLLDLFTGLGIFGLVVFSGGLWTVLLLRQVAAAFWFTVLVPGFILAFHTGLLAGFPDDFVQGMTAVVLGLYSLAGFFFARWLFFRAQDVQWTGGTIAMPEVRGLPAWLSSLAAKRFGHPRTALWWKELQLHQSQFVIALVLAVLHLGVIVTRNLGHFRKNSTTEFILEIFWGLWLVMPLIVGCAAVAEERKLGTLEGQLCLPAKRRTQFGIKLSAVLALSILFGVIMPLLLEGPKILPGIHIDFSQWYGWRVNSSGELSFGFALDAFNHLLPLLALAMIAAAIGVISFYASTLARNTLQAFAPAVMGVLLTWSLLVVAAQMQEFRLDFLWWGPLPFFIIVPVMVLALFLLSFQNFKNVMAGWNIWRRNLITVVLAFVFASLATTTIYHRAWEKLTPFEPAHGPARLSLSNPAKLSVGGGLFVRLPDGRIWMGYSYAPAAIRPNLLAYILGNYQFAPFNGQFVGDSNWVSMAQCWREMVGLKSDGTLWISATPERVIRLRNGRSKIEAMGKLAQFGTETDWSSFLPEYGRSLLLVKNDGTLWRLGTTNDHVNLDQWPGLRTFTPYRLGTESNWAEAFQDNYVTGLRKTDGSVWCWNDVWNTNGSAVLELEPGIMVVQAVPRSKSARFRSVANVWQGAGFKVGVRDDGTFRIWADERLNRSSHFGRYEWSVTDLQIGKETNWVAVAGDYRKLVTLKDDGSLWLWDLNHDYRRGWDTDRDEREIQNTIPIRLGTHSDWIAISSERGSITALAADGSLWFWPLEHADYFYHSDDSTFAFVPLLDISRKPQLIGNIFSKPN